MRKALVLFALLLVCGAGGVTYAALSIHPARDQVELTESVLYGDAAAAEGLVVESKAHYSNRLFWDTTHVVGAEPDSWTEFSVFTRKVGEEYDHSSSGVTIWSTTEGDMDEFYNGQDTEDWEPKGIGIALKKLLEETAPGQETYRNVRLADYYDYYPLDVTIDLPGYYFFTVYDEWEEAFGEEEGARQKAVYDTFTDFFRIPVLEDEEHEVHVGKNESGLLQSWGHGNTGDGPFFQMNVFSTVAGGACYFTFDACASDGETVVDTSLIPGGYGIYRLDWGYEGDPEDIVDGMIIYGGGWIDEDSLEMVYPLEPGIGWEYFDVSEDGSRLYLITEKDGTCTLTVIDTATMETLQQLELVTFGEDGGSISHVYREEDFWLVRISGGRIALLRQDDNGLLELQFLADYNPEEIPDYSLSYYTTAMDWNGERLAIVTDAYDEQYEAEWGYSARYSACAYCIAVYDESGEMLYCGRYDTSLKPAGLAPSGEGCAWFGQTICPFVVRWDW